MKYYTSKTVNRGFEDSIKHVTEKLKEEGFGVLTEIFMHEKFKEKLGIDFKKYAILGACNPPLAYESVKHEDKIGVLLPCNVVVQEIDDKTSEISAMDPLHMMRSLNNPDLSSVAEKVSSILNKVIENL